MSDRAPYSRVYWSINEDEKFDGIRDDPKLIGGWLLMLVAADQSYPAPAYLLPQVPRSTVAKLVEAGLIDPLDGHRFRVHGLATERERRSKTGPKRDPDGDQKPPRNRPKGNTDEDETRQGKDETRQTDPIVAYMRLTGTGRPSEYAAQKLRANAERYGHDEWLFAINQARDLYGTKNDIRNAEAIAEERYVAKQEEAKRRRQAEIDAARITPEQAEANRRRFKELQAEMLGRKGAA